MELRPEIQRRRYRLPMAQALRAAVLPTLGWLLVIALIVLAIPDWAWRAKLLRQGGLLIIGVLGVWRYLWYMTHMVRGFFYSRFVYPQMRYSAFIQRDPYPQRVYFLIPSYKENPGVTARVFTALAREAGSIPGVQVTAVAALAGDQDEDLVRQILASSPGGDRVRIAFVRQSQGKRKAMADSLRVIATLRAQDLNLAGISFDEGYNDAVVFMDGDTEMADGTLAQCLPFFKAYPRTGAVTTDELGRIYGASPLVREWFALKFIKRHSVMKSLSLSRKVLTLTGRFTVFRAPAVLSEELVQYLENDHVENWLYGRIRFLMGDDKSTWFCLLKNGWEMLYLPDVVIYALETRSDGFFRLSRSLYLRWNGNTLRTNSRALRLGPGRVGAFIWWAIFDQRISMWTTLVAPIAMVFLAIFVSPWFMAFYLIWMLSVRLMQILMLAAQGHRMRFVDVPLQLYDQWVSSFYKIVASFRLGKQSWRKGGTQTEGHLPASRAWVPTFQTVFSLLALVLFVGLLTGVFQTPRLDKIPEALEWIRGGTANTIDRATDATVGVVQDPAGAVQRGADRVEDAARATGQAADAALGTVGETVGDAARATGAAVQEGVETVEAVGEPVVDAAADAVQPAVEGTRAVGAAAADAAHDAAQGTGQLLRDNGATPRY
ncbi:MAG: glycosyltransferase [Rhodothermales bacterium]|nr:glycosyltransferase [Rhodothermales bacterium]